ncbi:MAG TPA: M48 family metalloprotease [Terriglobales bacterium]|nr:M48 family metalloprotease [Terriglobales bacterium]
MKNWRAIISATVLITISAVAQQPPAKNAEPAKVQSASSAVGDASSTSAAKSGSAPMTMEQVVDRTIQREHALMGFLRTRTPLVETYLQNLKRDPELGATPKDDRYFLGRLDLATTVERRDYLFKEESFEKNLLGGFTKLFRLEYDPMGFSWMIFADREEFDRAHYDFKYLRREFLGDVRCFVFDVTPKKDAGKGRFLGRIWVEDQDFNIVRLNGTYAPRPKNAYFFHLDSWRLNLIPGYWLPAYVYSEEGDFSYGSKDKVAFKAQTRIWGYEIKKKTQENELAQITVDAVKDESPTATDPSPLAAQREWQQQAEDNVIERLEAAGLLAPSGDVDKILLTVVNNLMITNNIDLPGQVRTRTMLTTPLETFSVGNTIVVSRGLVDVLPDEACLAMVLSHELAHIALGHNLGSKFAFTDRMLFSDQSTYQNFGFRHSPEEETAADAKALEMLKKSPYAAKLDSASLFLKELSARAPEIAALLTPHLGNSFTNDKGQLVRMPELANAGPELKPDKLDQVAALPLGGRLKVNAWDDQVELIKAAPVSLLSARDKMPFEVTPFFPRLSRLETGSRVAPTTVANRTPQK